MFTESLTGATIVLTGAASGIGSSTGQMLRAAGAQVIALDKKEPTYDVAEFIPVNLAEPDSIDAAVRMLGVQNVHGLCNVAGVPGTLPDMVVARVNYLGLRYLTMAVLPLMS